MRGQKMLTEARMNGYYPDYVHIVYFDERPNYTEMSDPETLIHYGYAPEVHIYKQDNLPTLDLRCLYATNVHIVAKHAVALKVAAAVKRFKPKAIYLPTGERA